MMILWIRSKLFLISSFIYKKIISIQIFDNLRPKIGKTVIYSKFVKNCRTGTNFVGILLNFNSMLIHNFITSIQNVSDMRY